MMLKVEELARVLQDPAVSSESLECNVILLQAKKQNATNTTFTISNMQCLINDAIMKGKNLKLGSSRKTSYAFGGNH